MVDDDEHTSLTYFVNSSFANGLTRNLLDPDGRGPNARLAECSSLAAGGTAAVSRGRMR